MKAFDRLRRLDAAERRLVIEAVWVLSQVRLALWLLPFDRVRKTYSDARTATPNSRAEVGDDVKRVAAAIHRAGRLVPSATCLPKALAAQVMLSRRDQPSELHIGVAKDDSGALQAHAWVELAGRVVIGWLPDLDRFGRMPRLPGGSA